MKTPVPVDNLGYLTKCPLCNRKYHFSRALILDEEENRTTFHLTCDSCQASTLVFVSMGQFGVVSLGMITDLDKNEARQLFKNDAISTDQVLEVHQFMKKFEGSVKDLI